MDRSKRRRASLDLVSARISGPVSSSPNLPPMNRAFSAPIWLLADEPRALPWADMADAVGVENLWPAASFFRPKARFIPAPIWLLADEPRALPWADMTDAVGVEN